jgi:xanthine dehydrogenase YagS FAD-binding subunit
MASRSAYLQISEKSSFDWALVSCAAAVVMDGDKVKSARVALGAVAPVPYQVETAHQFLSGKALNDATAAEAADLILREAKPLMHNAYKVPLAKTLIKRTLLKLKA